jgi:hypothetical protein
MKEVKDIVEEEEGIDLDNFELLESEEEQKVLYLEKLKKDGKILLNGEELFDVTVDDDDADFEVVDD